MYVDFVLCNCFLFIYLLWPQDDEMNNAAATVKEEIGSDACPASYSPCWYVFHLMYYILPIEF
jgi:hypothetical protein